MFKDIKVRLLFILALAVVSGWLLIQRGITLGLDLQGGTHLELAISNPDGALDITQREAAIDRALTVIRTRVNELGVAEPSIQKAGRDRIVVELPGATREEQQRAKDVIQRSAFLQFQIVQPASDIAPVLPRIDRAVASVADQLALPVDTAAQAAPPTAAAPGLDLFESADSAASDSSTSAAATDNGTAADTSAATVTQEQAEQPFTSKLAPGSAGDEGVFLVANADVPFVQRALALPEVRSIIPRDLVFRWGVDEDAATLGYRTLYLLDAEPLITGEYLQDAQAQRDVQLGQPIVTFEFDRRGGRIFERGTGQNVGNLMAIVLDDQVFSAPIIQSQIGSRGQIEMGGSGIEEASDLALVLRAGALPAPIEIAQERSIGPSLGQDSIDRGQIAGVVGVLLVVMIMIGYYRAAGAMAVAALVLYVLFVLAGLAGINATLTLPGIAGIILSIGMAVDANVLIFERLREELERGRSVRVAVNEGFSMALSAIVDGHLTTLITAFVLFQFGTGAVKGFAVTLSIGIVASLFTAIFVTRTFFMLYLDRRPTAETISI